MTLSSKMASVTASPFLTSLCSAIVRTPHRNVVTMNDGDNPNQLEEFFQKKRALRSKIRKELANMSPLQRAQEDNAIQRIILEAPWFKTSKNLCTYISSAALREVDTSKILSEVLGDPGGEGHAWSKKKVYVPRVEDRFSNMRMLKISSVDDLVASSMNILEPAPVACDLNEREDVMQACEPVDLFILPGLVFDKSGGRLGRGGGYYDMFLKNYRELVKDRNWKEPLLVALAYSVQIVEEGAIAVTPNDIPVDALISPTGFIPTSVAAMKRCN